MCPKSIRSREYQGYGLPGGVRGVLPPERAAMCGKARCILLHMHWLRRSAACRFGFGRRCQPGPHTVGERDAGRGIRNATPGSLFFAASHRSLPITRRSWLPERFSRRHSAGFSPFFGTLPPARHLGHTERSVSTIDRSSPLLCCPLLYCADLMI